MDESANFDEFDRMVRSGDPDAVTAVFSALDESARRALAPGVRTWADDLWMRGPEALPEPGDRGGEDSFGNPPDSESRWSDFWRYRDCSNIALLATATLAELKKRPRHRVVGVNGTTLGVLLDRQPEWCGDYIDHVLSRASWMVEWPALLALIYAGIIDIPTSSALPDLMVRWRLGAPRESWGEPILGRLREQWSIAEHIIWRFFSTPMTSLDGPDWRDAIRAQISSGQMDRGRVIDEILAGLRRDDFRPKQQRWLLALLGELELTEVEITNRVEAFTDLLATELPAIAWTAIAHLKRLDATEFVDADSMLRGLLVSVLSKTSKTASASLDLANHLRAAHCGLPSDVVRVALAGFGHHDRSIRDRSVELVATISADDAAVCGAMAAEIEQAVLGLPVSEVSAAATRLGVGTDLNPDLITGGVLDRGALEALSPEARLQWQVDEALDALDSDEVPPPLRLPDPCVNPAALGAPVPAVADVAELAALIGHSLEHGEDVLAAERALDGMSRFGLELRSSTKLYQALLRQAGLVGGRRPSGSSGPPSGCLRVFSMLDDPTMRRYEMWWSIGGLGDLTWVRALDVGLRLRDETHTPLLSVPSHSGGWVTPEALVSRVNAWPASVAISESDIVCALLRLHTVGAAEALAALNVSTTTDASAAVAVALGGEADRPIQSDLVRVVAEDARGRVTEAGWSDHLRTVVLQAMRERTVESPSVAAILLRTSARGRVGQRWAVSAAPSYLDLAMLPALSASQHKGELPAAGMLEQLLDGHQPLGSVAQGLLVMALSCDEGMTRIFARDVCVALIGDGRLDTRSMGAGIGRYLTHDLVKANRVFESLAVVSDASDLHGDEVLHVLDSLVATLEQPPPNVHLLLELATELHVSFGRPVTDSEACAVLDRWTTGSSRRAKAAKALLAVPEGPSNRRVRAAEARVMLRVDRARHAAAAARDI